MGLTRLLNASRYLTMAKVNVKKCFVSLYNEAEDYCDMLIDECVGIAFLRFKIRLLFVILSIIVCMVKTFY